MEHDAWYGPPPMGPDGVAWAMAAAAYAILAFRWRRGASTWTWIDRLGAILVIPAVAVFARVVVRLAVGALQEEWNGCRLAPAVALTRGFALYYPASEGPILDTIYGPVVALAYLPAAFFSAPTPVILAGAVLNIAFVTVPLLLFALRAAGTGAAAELRAIACWLGGCLLMTAMPGPYYWLSMTHADGPALALGLLACVVLLRRSNGAEPGPTGFAVAATFATLSAWAKLTSLPVGISLVPVVGWAYGRRAALRYALSLLAAGIVTAVVFTSLFGLRDMWFNLITVPSHHPWYFPGAGGLLRALQWMVRTSTPVVGLLAAAAIASLAGRGGAPVPRPHAALVPLLPALLLVPTGVLAANKFGGNVNSFHSLYFLLAAALALLVVEAPSPRLTTRGCAYAFCALAALVTWRHGNLDLRDPAPTVLPNPHQEAYAFARAHPGTVYFPWYPLASLLAEGRLYHFDWGVFDRMLGGSAPTAEHFRADLPRQLEYVAIRGRDAKVMSYLPEYTEKRSSDELPGWTLLARPVDTSASGAARVGPQPGD
jgi:hypothetical protein